MSQPTDSQKSPKLLAILLENQPGSLARVVGLFAQRGYNIEAMNVATTDDKTLSRLTVEVYCTEMQTDQILKQLNRLIDVVRVTDLSSEKFVQRELMLISVRADSPDLRAEIMRSVTVFRAQVVDLTDQKYTIQITGKSSKLKAFIECLPASSVLEVARTGKTGLARGLSAKGLSAKNPASANKKK